MTECMCSLTVMTVSLHSAQQVKNPMYTHITVLMAVCVCWFECYWTVYSTGPHKRL